MRAFLSLFLPLLISSLHAEKIITNPNWVARNTPVVTVDSILLRDTVSRMYITLKQLPHTSLTIHDDWVVQDSIKRFTGKVRDIDGVDFDRIFQFDSDSTIHIEMDFPALPPSLTEVDIIGNQKSNEIRIIGLSLTEKRNKTSIYPHPDPIYRSATPAITFDTDTAILQGKFVGYHTRRENHTGRPVLRKTDRNKHSYRTRRFVLRKNPYMLSYPTKTNFWESIYPFLYRTNRYALHRNVLGRIIRPLSIFRRNRTKLRSLDIPRQECPNQLRIKENTIK